MSHGGVGAGDGRRGAAATKPLALGPVAVASSGDTRQAAGRPGEAAGAHRMDKVDW